MNVIDVHEKFERFSDQWAPKIIAQMNDYHFKLARIKGEFVWHSHPETDEVFYVIDGSMVLRFRDREVPLGKGQMLVVPRGVEHNPYAEHECLIMLVELAGTVNTGDLGGERTVQSDDWL